MIGYYSPLLLPSNGLEYNSIVYLKELTIGSVFIHYDSFYVNMEIGKIISILNKHFKHKEISDVADMYYGDVIYMWNYLCSRSFNVHEAQKPFQCENCKKEKLIKIPLKNIPINYLKEKKIEIEYKVNNDFSIFYRRRKIIDSVHFTFYTLEDKKEDFDYIYNYTKEQILYIKDNKKNKIIEKDNFKDFLNHIGIKLTYDFFKKIRLEDFSFDSDYVAICDQCQTKNQIKLIDPIDISFFHKGLEIDISQYQNIMETLMTISSLKYMSVTELLETPNSKFNIIIDAVKKIQDEKYGKNKGSYFDQVMEDM
jgi:hypothetical protein